MKKYVKVILLGTTTFFATSGMADAGPAAAILGAAFATGGFAGITFSSIFGLGWFGSFLARAALGLALNALSPKPKTAGANRGYQVTSRGSALDHQVVYGKVRQGGVIVYDHTTGDNNKFLHRIIAFTGHEIDSFDEIYLNDELVTIGVDNFVDTPVIYGARNLVRIKKYYGTEDQVADPDLVAETAGETDGQWTTDHRLRGISYLYIRFQFEGDEFPNGIPEITATIKGKPVYDPRSELTEWSDNPALCVRDYLTSDYGLRETSDYIDDDLVTVAANVCDEVDTLASDTRYTCNGAFVTSITPYDILGDLLTSMGGLLWYSQGKWRMKAATWTTPVLSLNEDDLRSGIDIQTRFSRRDNFNKVTGTFRGEESNWQVTDYPEVTNGAFLTADNGQESVIDFDLPFTDASLEARRLGRIFLERNRQQLTINATFGLKALQLQVGDNITLTNTRMGWTDKEFEVSTWTMNVDDGGDISIAMTLRETAESIFDEFDDGVVYERDNTTLPSPFVVPTVGLTTESQLVVYREKLTNFLFATVTSSSESQVDQVELQFKKSSESIWIRGGFGEIGRFEILDLEDDSYDIRARAINTFGIKGEWTTLSDIEVEGLKDPPADVTNFFAQVSGDMLTLSWTPVADLDLSYYYIRYSPVQSGATWANSIDYVKKVPRPAASVSVPAKAGTYLIKSYDKTNISSEGYTSVVVAGGDITTYANNSSLTDSPTFSGTKSNTSVTSGELRLTTYTAANATGTYQFSTYIDTGSVNRCRVYIDAENERFTALGDLFDGQSGFFDSAPGLFDDAGGDTQFPDTNVTTEVSYTDDDPTVTPTWSAWKTIQSANISARAFRFRLTLDSETADVTPSVVAATAYVSYN